MTIWTPDLSRHGGPRYRAIASALHDDILSGRLAPGTRLPTHRDLAWRLQVTVGTVTRAYAEAERRGLIGGEVGRGTYVRDLERPADGGFRSVVDTSGDVIDLSVNAPSVTLSMPAIRDAMAAVAARPDLATLLTYQHTVGSARHRSAAAAWLEHAAGVQVSADQIAIAGGGQGAMHLAMASVTRPGDVVLTEEMTYVGMKALSAHLGLRLVPVAMDQNGILPDAVEQACRQHGARALYVMPTLHNPTTATMPLDRRHALIEVARRHDLTLVEDEVYGFLLEQRPPALASLAPDITLFVSSASKNLAPSLRVGFLAMPAPLVDRAAAITRATLHDFGHFGASIAAELIESGAAHEVAVQRRAEIARRQAVARCILSGTDLSASHPAAPHLWLQLPEPWRREDFARELLNRGVKVTQADVFAAGRVTAPHAVRICIGTTDRTDQMQTALQRIASLLQAQQSVCSLTV
jgi:DNA-binding transcriptional MocR family regulator